MKTKLEKFRFGFAILTVSALNASVGCNSNEDGVASDGSGSEVASAAIGGVVSASEGVVASEQSIKKQTFWAHLKNSMVPIPLSYAVPACSWHGNMGSCNSNMETLTYDDCSSLLDREISLQGSETLFWTGQGCCTSNPLTASSNTPCAFTRRTVNQAGKSDPLTRSVGSHSITLDTEGSSGFSDAKRGGFLVTCQGVSGNNSCDGQRRVDIQGAHYRGNSGSAQWDHTVSTDLPLMIQGHGSQRQVLSGKIRTQHNLAQYVSVTTVTSPLTYEDGCCFPSGGAISTSFVGGTLDGKSETIQFGQGRGCGYAHWIDSNQKQSNLTWVHCL